MTGIGTVLADDPRLTARGVRRRRIARRVIVDPKLQTPLTSRLIATLDQAPLTIAVRQTLLDAAPANLVSMRDAGAEFVGLPTSEVGGLPLEPLLRHLASEHDITTIMVEGGAGLFGRLFAHDLVCEAWVFTAPILFGDESALPPVRGLLPEHPDDARRFRMLDVRHRDGDVVTRYLRIADASYLSRPNSVADNGTDIDDG